MRKMEKNVSILGAGQMGIALAATFLKHGFSVRLFDASNEAVCSAKDRVSVELRCQNVPDPSNIDDKFSCTNELYHVVETSVILETITEKKRAKQKLYQQLLPALADDTLLLTNTSTISISQLAESVILPERFCGFHFFHPVRERPLVEIVRGKQTSTATLEQAKLLAQKIEKRAILVNDGPGFLVNRLLNPYLAQALQLLADGESLRRVDAVAEQFGMALGPFRMIDEIGLDVVLHGGWVLHKAFPDRISPSPVLLELIENGHLGRKTGRGFYRYDITQEDVCSIPSGQQAVSNEMILERLIGGMKQEADRLLDEKITDSKEDIELAVKLGLGFPKNRSFMLEE